MGPAGCGPMQLLLGFLGEAWGEEKLGKEAPSDRGHIREVCEPSAARSLHEYFPPLAFLSLGVDVEKPRNLLRVKESAQPGGPRERNCAKGEGHTSMANEHAEWGQQGSGEGPHAFLPMGGSL